MCVCNLVPERLALLNVHARQVHSAGITREGHRYRVPANVGRELAVRQLLGRDRRSYPPPITYVTHQLHEIVERSRAGYIHCVLYLRVVGLERADVFKDPLNLPPRLLTVTVVNPLELGEHPVEGEDQNEGCIRGAGISLSSHADFLQLALAGPRSDGLSESPVQLVHVVVSQIEVSLKLLQIAAMFR